MKLKIDDIANQIIYSTLPTSSSDRIMGTNSGKVYISDNGEILYDVDESWCYAHAIVDHILPNYIEKSGMKFQDIIKTDTYDELKGAGFLNGIPYFKSCVKIPKTEPEIPYKKPSFDEVIDQSNYSKLPLYKKPSFDEVIDQSEYSKLPLYEKPSFDEVINDSSLIDKPIPPKNPYFYPKYKVFTFQDFGVPVLVLIVCPFLFWSFINDLCSNWNFKLSEIAVPLSGLAIVLIIIILFIVVCSKTIKEGRQINKNINIRNKNNLAQYKIDLCNYQEDINKYYEDYCKEQEKLYYDKEDELNKYYEYYCIQHEKLYNDKRKELNKYYEDYCKEHYEQYEEYIDKYKKIEHQTQYLQSEYAKIRDEFDKKQNALRKQANDLRSGYEGRNKEMIESYFKFILDQSFYPFEFGGNTKIEYLPEPKVLLVEYDLPNLNQVPNIKDFRYLKTQNVYKKIELSERELQSLYNDVIYKITIRSISELFQFDENEIVDVINFNGRVSSINKATGISENNCILSVQIKRKDFEQINIENIDAKACFKHFSGVGSAKLCDITAIVPIMEISRKDKRFIDAKNVNINDYTNLATMDWEDFEHLIRELFDKEFNQNGGEVKVTQSSRDGGVDAIAFDPDPIRGGKVVIQAKRYSNTVGVSAVRDLYGTVINEGANKGILITTSDYGSDSYNFAKGKPITLLNGGHLLYLLEKHGQKARIDLVEAKEINGKK